MKSILLLLCSLAVAGIACAQSAPGYTNCTTLLEKVSRQLNSLQHIRYHYKRVLDYSSENYHHEADALVYLDFNSPDTLTGFRYQIVSASAKEFFNGTEKFTLSEQEKTIDIDPQPVKKSFTSSFFYNSPVTLKNILPLIIADNEIKKSVRDTIVNGSPCYIAELILHKKTFGNPGKQFDNMTQDRYITYHISIDAQSLLPLKIRQGNNVNTDYTETSFADFDSTGYTPTEKSWFYSTYTAVYKPTLQKETAPLPAAGSAAPGFTLPLYNTQTVLSLDQLKGKVVVLDFWIKNCGPCIESTPHLNTLHKKFSNKKFRLLSINAYDNKEDISWFCKKHAIDYTVLMNGKAVAEQYGVNGFPTFFIIDKEGNIVYAAPGFTPSTAALIEKMIEKNIVVFFNAFAANSLAPSQGH